MKKMGLMVVGAAVVLVGIWVIKARVEMGDAVSEVKVAENEVMNGDLMVMVERSGGLCPGDRVCGDKIAIFRDGKMTRDRTGERAAISSEEAEQISNTITKRNVDELKRKKFTGLCPTAYDGIEVIYTFEVEGKKERVSSCEYEIPVNNPVIGQVAKALETVGW